MSLLISFIHRFDNAGEADSRWAWKISEERISLKLRAIIFSFNIHTLIGQHLRGPGVSERFKDFFLKKSIELLKSVGKHEPADDISQSFFEESLRNLSCTIYEAFDLVSSRWCEDLNLNKSCESSKSLLVLECEMYVYCHMTGTHVLFTNFTGSWTNLVYS